MSKKGNRTMKNYYEKMNERIATYGKNRDTIIKEYESKIEKVKEEIALSEKAMNEAVKYENLNDYTEQKNMLSMKKQMLAELEKGLYNAQNYPTMFVAEHTAMREELKNHTLSLLAEKYAKILKLFDEGEVILKEFEAIVKEYYHTFELLDSKVSGFEEDETGAKYKIFATNSNDLCYVDRRLDELFRNNSSYRSVKNIVKNKMETLSFTS